MRIKREFRILCKRNGVCEAADAHTNANRDPTYVNKGVIGNIM
jgi:hypothetical protein